MDPIPVTQPATPSADKTIGYLLLTIGIIIICAALAWLFLTFTGNSKPPQVFNVEAPSIPVPAAGFSLDETTLPPQIANSIKETQNSPQSIKLIPDDVFSSLMNMSVFYLLAMFISSTGAKIASIGVSLIKNPKPKS